MISSSRMAWWQHNRHLTHSSDCLDRTNCVGSRKCSGECGSAMAIESVEEPNVSHRRVMSIAHIHCLPTINIWLAFKLVRAARLTAKELPFLWHMLEADNHKWLAYIDDDVNDAYDLLQFHSRCMGPGQHFTQFKTICWIALFYYLGPHSVDWPDLTPVWRTPEPWMGSIKPCHIHTHYLPTRMWLVLKMLWVARMALPFRNECRK